MPDSRLVQAEKQTGAMFAGEGPPTHYGDPAAEYRTARSEAAVFDLSDRTQIELTGADRAKFLHNFCTNDVKRLEPGQGCEAFVTNVKGRVLAHVFVFAGTDSIWIETVPGAEEPLLAHLDRYLITEDAALHGRTAEWGELFVSGPLAAERRGSEKGTGSGRPESAESPDDVHSFNHSQHTNDAHGRCLSPFRSANAPGTAIINLPLYGHVQTEAFGDTAAIRRVDLLGAPGFLLSVPRGRLADLWNALADAGMRPAGTAAFEALRIEAGMPLYGVDISDDNLAQEVGRTKQAISFTKGCYLGQEPIARIDALGHVNRELRGLKFASGPVPAPGTSVVADGKEVGRVTSSTVSFADGLPVALAYLRKGHVASGTQVAVDIDGTSVPATVFGLGEEHSTFTPHPHTESASEYPRSRSGTASRGCRG
jgi:tRNA-modifying protein YgfZ